MRRIAICVALLLMAGSFCARQAESQMTIFNGRDWVAIDEYKITLEEKQSIKESMVKAVVEAAYFNSVPVVAYDPEMNFKPFVDTIDKFYKIPENRIFPLYFTVKLAEMVQRHTPESVIHDYKIAVIDKLKKSGFLK